jgi:bifunctional non-homologous end joining protein LigD
MFWPNVSPLQPPTPMLVEHAPLLPKGADWEYEYSWPGERVIVTKNDPGVRLISASHRRDLTNRFPVVAAAVAKLNAPAVVLDGVIRPLEPAQAAVVGLTLPESPTRPIELRFIATDLLWIGNLDLRQLPLEMRKQRLVELAGGSAILVAATLDVPVREMLAQAARVGADGVIAKRRESRYRPFARTGDWVRVTVDSAGAGGIHSVASELRRPPGGLGTGHRPPFGTGWGHALT